MRTFRDNGKRVSRHHDDELENLVNLDEDLAQEDLVTNVLALIPPGKKPADGDDRLDWPELERLPMETLRSLVKRLPKYRGQQNPRRATHNASAWAAVLSAQIGSLHKDKTGAASGDGEGGSGSNTTSEAQAEISSALSPTLACTKSC